MTASLTACVSVFSSRSSCQPPLGSLCFSAAASWRRCLSEPEILDLAHTFLIIHGVLYVILALLFDYRYTLQGLGDARIPTIAGLMELAMRTFSAFVLARRAAPGHFCVLYCFQEDSRPDGRVKYKRIRRDVNGTIRRERRGVVPRRSENDEDFLLRKSVNYHRQKLIISIEIPSK